MGVAFKRGRNQNHRKGAYGHEVWNGAVKHMDQGNRSAGDKISCQKCRYYQVTWDPNLPYGCTAHDFKSRKNPALVVYEASGLECQLFQPKPQRGEK